jgi:hypothetical protein
MPSVKIQFVHFHSPNLELPGRLALFSGFSGTFAVLPDKPNFPPPEVQLARLVGRNVPGPLRTVVKVPLNSRLEEFIAGHAETFCYESGNLTAIGKIKRAEKNGLLACFDKEKVKNALRGLFQRPPGFYRQFTEAYAQFVREKEAASKLAQFEKAFRRLMARFTGYLQQKNIDALAQKWAINKFFFRALDIIREETKVGTTALPLTFLSRSPAQIIQASITHFASQLGEHNLTCDVDAPELKMSGTVFLGQIQPISKLVFDAPRFLPQDCLIICNNHMARLFEPGAKDTRVLNIQTFDEADLRARIRNRLPIAGVSTTKRQKVKMRPSVSKFSKTE